MKPGTQVEVRNRFDGMWVGGFVLEDEIMPTGAAVAEPETAASTASASAASRPIERVVRRASDGVVLPAFPAAEVRRERQRGRSTWWY